MSALVICSIGRLSGLTGVLGVTLSSGKTEHMFVNLLCH